MNNGPAKNTDRRLWPDENDYGDYIFVTEGGEGIGFCVNGDCIVKPLRDWHNLASPKLRYDKEKRTIVPVCEHVWWPWETYVKHEYLVRQCRKCFGCEIKLATEVPETEPRGGFD